MPRAATLPVSQLGTTEEVAKFLQVTTATVLRLARMKQIPAIRVSCGKRNQLWRFRWSDIDLWLESRKEVA